MSAFDFKSIHNFWDCGGCTTQNGSRIRKHVLFRSGTLAHATESDLATLTHLGIRTICDLRSQQEQRKRPDRLPHTQNLRYVHIPVKNITGLATFFNIWIRGKDSSELLKRLYRVFITDFNREFADVLHLLTDPTNLPLLIHCTAGKDRTGFACATIQLALGVPLADVRRAYLHSNTQLRPFQEEMLQKLRPLIRLGFAPHNFSPFFEVRAAYLDAALAQIRETYGTIDAYLRRGLRLTPAKKTQLQENLLV